jgi:hypothetical protein
LLYELRIRIDGWKVLYGEHKVLCEPDYRENRRNLESREKDLADQCLPNRINHSQSFTNKATDSHR